MLPDLSPMNYLTIYPNLDGVNPDFLCHLGFPTFYYRNIPDLNLNRHFSKLL